MSYREPLCTQDQRGLKLMSPMCNPEYKNVNMNHQNAWNATLNTNTNANSYNGNLNSSYDPQTQTWSTNDVSPMPKSTGVISVQPPQSGLQYKRPINYPQPVQFSDFSRDLSYAQISALGNRVGAFESASMKAYHVQKTKEQAVIALLSTL